jgi:hypothetical protein
MLAIIVLAGCPRAANHTLVEICTTQHPLIRSTTISQSHSCRPTSIDTDLHTCSTHVHADRPAHLMNTLDNATLDKPAQQHLLHIDSGKVCCMLHTIPGAGPATVLILHSVLVDQIYTQGGNLHQVIALVREPAVRPFRPCICATQPAACCSRRARTMTNQQ